MPGCNIQWCNVNGSYWPWLEPDPAGKKVISSKKKVVKKMKGTCLPCLIKEWPYWKRERMRGKSGGTEREWKRRSSQHHSTSCCCGAVERFIDQLRNRSVRGDEEVGQREGGRGRDWRRPIWMTESEGIRFLGLIDNDIPAWAVR